MRWPQLPEGWTWLRVVRTIPRWILLGPIWVYQRYVSPMLGPRCKYYPTCSAYAVTALQRHGVIRGSALALWRLARCNPWSMGGVDYVPPVRERHAHPQGADHS